MVLRNLWRRKIRTLLTVAGIAIGIAVVVALLVVADGIAGQLNDMMSGSGAEITVMQAEVADMQFSILDEEVGMELSQIPQVQWVSGLLLQIAPVEKKQFFLLIGLDTSSDAFQHFRVVEGEVPKPAGEILLGRMAADFMGKGPGDWLTIHGQILQVSGIYETGVGFEDGGGLIPLAMAQELFKRKGQVSFYHVKVLPEHLDQLDQVTQVIQDRIPLIRAYRSSVFGENTPDIQVFQSLAGIVSLIGLSAGALGTMNTMLMSVFERTREIGALRALGWRKGRVMRMILSEALLLCLIGGVTGIGLGAGLVSLINLSPQFADLIKIHLNTEAFAVGLIVALLLGLFGGMYPAWRAMQLQPLEALRYE
jgi:ABC-type antimicrobial peptide transport system permease subunit